MYLWNWFVNDFLGLFVCVYICEWNYPVIFHSYNILIWRRKWQPTPVFLPGESHGQRSLMGCHLWGCTELDRLRSSSSNIFIRLLSQCFAGYTKLVTNYFLSNFSGRVFFFFLIWYYFFSTYLKKFASGNTQTRNFCCFPCCCFFYENAFK